MSRTSMLLTLAATALLSAPARAINPPPQTGAGSGSGTPAVRERCSGCRARVEDRYREKLLLQIDSLRWHIEHRRLSEEDRQRTVSELNAAIRSLQQSLDETARSSAVTTVAVEAASAAAIAPSVAVTRITMRARGYLGVTFDGPHTEVVRPGEHALRFYQYPRIALVEPSSPADRAGVMQGDTVMSLNGIDLTQNEINLTKLLVPESKIVMRVRRDGNPKELRVTIGEAPAYYVRRREAPVRVRAYGMPGSEAVRVGSLPSQPEPAHSPVLWQGYEGIAGARVETISEGLGRALGVREGVLVVGVRPGTPAYRAGLRDGDVIVRAANERIGTVAALRGIVAAGDRDEGVTLLIRRERKERDITLRW
jgi:S1-C subfamily serine protease